MSPTPGIAENSRGRSSRNTDNSARMSVRACRPVEAMVSSAVIAACGSCAAPYRPPSAWAITTVRECATMSCISRAMRVRSPRACEFGLLGAFEFEQPGSFGQALDLLQTDPPQITRTPTPASTNTRPRNVDVITASCQPRPSYAKYSRPPIDAPPIAISSAV